MTTSSHEMLLVIPALESKNLRVTPDRCLQVRHRKANCLRCAHVCTSGAISASSEGIAIDPSLCIGCGTCAGVCPSACLEALNPNDSALIEGLVSQNNASSMATISCSRAAESTATAAQVECLGRVEEGILIEAVARGVAYIQLVSGPCEQCPHKAGNSVCEEVLASAQNILEALGANAHIERIRTNSFGAEKALDAQPEAPHNAKPNNADPVLDTPVYTHVQKDGTLPHFVPEKRLRLFNSMKHLGSPVQPLLTTRVWGQVVINTELCSSCRMCSVFCPTGALIRFEEADGSFGIDHRSALCMQCRLCETICPERALEVSSTVSLPEFLEGKKIRYTMQALEFNPGGADSISTRVARFVKTDAFQDPQGTLSIHDVIDRRAYAKARDARRKEIREENKVDETPSEN